MLGQLVEGGLENVLGLGGRAESQDGGGGVGGELHFDGCGFFRGVLRGRGVCYSEELSELDWIGMKKMRERKRDEEEYKCNLFSLGKGRGSGKCITASFKTTSYRTYRRGSWVIRRYLVVRGAVPCLRLHSSPRSSLP